MTNNDLSEPLLGAEAGRAEDVRVPPPSGKKRWPITRTLLAAIIAHLSVAAWQLGFQWPPRFRACTHQWHDCRGLACATVALSIFVSWLLAELYSIAPKTGSPEDRAGLVATYTFWWVTPTLRKANNQGKLKPDDLPQLPTHDRASFLKKRFSEAWLDVVNKRSLLVTLLYGIQKRVLISTLLHGWAFLGLMFLDPLVLKRLLDAADDQKQTHRNYGYALFLAVSMFLRVACMEVCFFGSVRVMNNARTAVAPAVFAKALRHETDMDSGSLTNLMATDADKLGGGRDGLPRPVELCSCNCPRGLLHVFVARKRGVLRRRYITSNKSFIDVACETDQTYRR